MSVCKVHHRPGCSLAPCSQILYNQSKVTCEKLHAELCEISRHSQDFATNVNTQTHQCTNHPGRTNPYCVTQAQTQMIPFGPKSKLPRPIKRSSDSTRTLQKKLPGPIKRSPGSTHTFPLNFGSPMGEGKHPNKPTCVIKASRTAAAFSRLSELTTLEEQLMLESPLDVCNITQGSPVVEQPGAPLAPNPSPIPTIGAAALAQGEGPQHAGNTHHDIPQCSDSLLLMSGHPLPAPESLKSVQSSPREALDTSTMAPPLLGGRSSGSTHPSPLDCGSAMGEGKHPIKPTCMIKASRMAAALSRFYQLKQTFASLENLFVPQQQTLCVTSPSSASDVTSLVQPHIQLSSASHSPVPVLASAQLSTQHSSLDPTTADDSTRDSAT